MPQTLQESLWIINRFSVWTLCRNQWKQVKCHILKLLATTILDQVRHIISKSKTFASLSRALGKTSHLGRFVHLELSRASQGLMISIYTDTPMAVGYIMLYRLSKIFLSSGSHHPANEYKQTLNTYIIYVFETASKEKTNVMWGLRGPTTAESSPLANSNSTPLRQFQTFQSKLNCM